MVVLQETLKLASPAASSPILTAIQYLIKILTDSSNREPALQTVSSCAYGIVSQPDQSATCRYNKHTAVFFFFIYHHRPVRSADWRRWHSSQSSQQLAFGFGIALEAAAVASPWKQQWHRPQDSRIVSGDPLGSGGLSPRDPRVVLPSCSSQLDHFLTLWTHPPGFSKHRSTGEQLPMVRARTVSGEPATHHRRAESCM